MAKPKDQQKCKYCESAAIKSLIWADGRAYVPVCAGHEQVCRNMLKKKGDGVTDVVDIDQSLPVYRDEDRDPIFAIAKKGLAEAPPTFAPRNFSRGVTTSRSSSGMQPADQPAGRTAGPASPRPGAKPQRLGGPTTPQYKAPKAPAGTLGIGPQNIFGMLATDWKTFRMQRVHDNRLNIIVDGQRYTVYMRCG